MCATTTLHRCSSATALATGEPMACGMADWFLWVGGLVGGGDRGGEDRGGGVGWHGWRRVGGVPQSPRANLTADSLRDRQTEIR